MSGFAKEAILRAKKQQTDFSNQGEVTPQQIRTFQEEAAENESNENFLLGETVPRWQKDMGGFAECSSYTTQKGVELNKWEIKSGAVLGPEHFPTAVHFNRRVTRTVAVIGDIFSVLKLVSGQCRLGAIPATCN